MKKNIVLFVLLAALAVFGSVFAQVDAPLDMTVAEPFLGTWFMTEICGQGQCMDASMLGMSGMSITFKDDSTMTVTFADEKQGGVPWYTENGIAYACSGEDSSKCTWLPMSISEDGKLTMGDETSSMVLIRDEVKPFGTADVKADAAYEDFQGEWFMESMISNGVSIPTSMFGMTGKLTIREDSLDLSAALDPMSAAETTENVAYKLNDGKITAEIINGEKTETVTMEYHIDDSVVLVMEDNSLVFVREENVTSGPSLLDMLSEAMAGEEGTMPGYKEVEIGNTGYKISIPEDYAEGELDEEDLADDMIAYYYSDPSQMDFDIYLFPTEGQSYMEYARSKAAAFGVEEDAVEDWQVNGIDMAKYYSTEEYNGNSFPCVTWTWEAGDNFVQIIFWLDGEGPEDLADQIIFSLKK